MVEYEAFVDDFSDDRTPGSTIGSVGSSGARRAGVDLEGVIGIDHGALRIEPLLDAGWGRSALVYGPYRRRNGLMLAVLMLNGHNTSQIEPLPESLAKRLGRWLQGHGDRRFGLVRRLGQFLRYKRKSLMVRRLRIWRHMATRVTTHHDENLAVGWFGSATEQDPTTTGNSFVMHAAKGDNGELWARTAEAMLPTARGVQNIPMLYVVVLREQGAAYYAASLPGSQGVGALPNLRPMAIDAFETGATVYAGIHQAALGQIGFRVDTRVYGVQVGQLGVSADWFGTAHAADGLTGEGSLDGSSAKSGEPWKTVHGRFDRGGTGVSPNGEENLAVLVPTGPTGLVHVVVQSGPGTRWSVGPVWRYLDPEHYCRLEVSIDECRLVVRDGDQTVVVASDSTAAVRPGEANSVQVSDIGVSVSLSVNGASMFGGPVALDHFVGATGVGLYASDAEGCTFARFEAHAREIDLGDQLKLPTPWDRRGTTTVAADDFEGPTGQDLADRRTLVGDRPWRRQYGHGHIVCNGEGSAAVVASIDRPNPGNTAYTIAWDEPEFADIAVDVTPPGDEFGQGQRGRGGLVFWQDPDNFIMVSMYLDDSYDGASIAIFSHLDGFEEIYDAVWSMVGRKIYYGRRHRLRIVSDGMNLLTLIDEEPVLYRQLTDIYVDRDRLDINRVGLVVNWEWGDDTGTVFDRFEARKDVTA